MAAYKIERFIEPNALKRAIALTYGAMLAEGGDPGSEKWNHPEAKQALVSRVRDIWAETTSYNWWDFPFNVQFVHSSWIRYRKLSSAERLSAEEELGL